MKKMEEWIEYMEGETGPQETADLNLLLDHSPEDRTVLENLRRLRRALHEAHESPAVEKLLRDRNYLERLHSQIMRGVRRRPGRPRLKVVERENALSLPPDPSLSPVTYNR